MSGHADPFSDGLLAESLAHIRRASIGFAKVGNPMLKPLRTGATQGRAQLPLSALIYASVFKK